LKARERPEEFQGLIVRVGGFSDYFVRLSAELQSDVIARAQHAL
jgi:formate C-acetyltransferase